METGGETTGGNTGRWAHLTTRAKGWMTPGQRWTSGLILIVVGLLLAFGAPRAITAAAEPTAGATAAPEVPRQLAAFPPTPPPRFTTTDLVAPPAAPTAPVAGPSPQVAAPPATPPTPAPAPTPPAGPCAIDTGLPVPVARTIVTVLAATQTTLAKLGGQPPPVDLASMLGSLAQCPPPA